MAADEDAEVTGLPGSKLLLATVVDGMAVEEDSTIKDDELIAAEDELIAADEDGEELEDTAIK